MTRPDASGGVPSPTPPEALVVMTGSASVTIGREHQRFEVPWSEFCAKLTALADKVPAEKNPVVSFRYGTITVTWRE